MSEGRPTQSSAPPSLARRMGDPQLQQQQQQQQRGGDKQLPQKILQQRFQQQQLRQKQRQQVQQAHQQAQQQQQQQRQQLQSQLPQQRQLPKAPQPQAQTQTQPIPLPLHPQQTQLHPQQQQQPPPPLPKSRPQNLAFQKIPLQHPPQPSPTLPPNPPQQTSDHFLIHAHPRVGNAFRSLHIDSDTESTAKDEAFPTLQSQPSETATRHHTPGSGAGTPKPVASKPGTPKPGTPKPNPSSKPGTPRSVAISRVELPICSSRGRALFGEVSWIEDKNKKDGGAALLGRGPGNATTTSSAPATPVATGNSSSSSSNSLRASVFKKRGGSALMAGAGSSAAGGAAAAAARNNNADAVGKDGRPKPWHIAVPQGIPHYVSPAPARRFGALAKGAARPGMQTPTLSQSSSNTGMGGRTASGNSSGTNTGYGNVRGHNANVNASNAVANRRQKPPTTKYLDFTPWTGRHPEDRITETKIRNGHHDRLSPGQPPGADTTSARPGMLLLLKQKPAILSQALGLANFLSREKNHVSPASQFKLPPRVTVTDTRRETWLRDLTNSAIPLRKLSRTIPHGLRGKVLLEQCMLKNVPVDRAMWLARCVGAQELRAFKRKGTTTAAGSNANLVESEIRWLKEWTCTVQQFLEPFMADLDMDKATGQERLQYAVRFVRQLYVERLLDQEQFLNWMLAGLEMASRQPIPTTPSTPYFGLWLYVVEEYYDDIVQRRRTACHLVAATLARLEYLSNIGTPLASSQPRKIFDKLVEDFPDTFVCLSVWPRYEKLVTSLLQENNVKQRQLQLAHISERHRRLRPALPAEMEQITTMLQPLDEALRRPVEFALHFAGFLQLHPDNAVPFVIRWCASLHRPGLAKVFLSARLINELCCRDAKLVTKYVLAFLRADREKRIRDAGGAATDETRQRYKGILHREHQHKLHALNDRQSEGLQALYQLVSVLIADKRFLVGQYLASLILTSRPSDEDEVGPSGCPQVRLAAELPAHLLDQPMVNLRANLLHRLGYDTQHEAEDIASILQRVEESLQTGGGSVAAPGSTSTSLSAPSTLAQTIENRGRCVKMAVADWLAKHVVHPMAVFGKGNGDNSGSSNNNHNNNHNPANMTIERASTIRSLVEKTDDMPLLSTLILSLASRPQTIQVMAMCVDTVNLHLSSFVALGKARQLYDVVMGRSLAMTVGLDGGVANAYQTMLPPGSEVRPLLMALPDLAAKMLPPGPSSIVLGVDDQPLRLVPKAGSGSGGDTSQAPLLPTSDALQLQKRYESGTAMASEIRSRLLSVEDRLGIATFDADCSPVSDGRNPREGQETTAADEVREEMAKIASSGGDIDDPTMDRLFGTIAMICQEKWRRLVPEHPEAQSRDDLRVAASLFARLRRFNGPHYDSIMVKWLKRLRTMRDRPPIESIYPVFVVFGALDLSSLLATTADEQPRDGGGVGVGVSGVSGVSGGLQTPARNTWRTGYLQDVLDLLTVPLQDGHPMLTCDECLRFRLFQAEAPFAAPTGMTSLVRNTVAEMILWRHYQRHGGNSSNPSSLSALNPASSSSSSSSSSTPRKTMNALAVTRLLRVCALADATAASQGLSRTPDTAVRRGLWEMMTLTLTRKQQPQRTTLDMLRDLDIFAADVGQLALGLTVAMTAHGSHAQSHGQTLTQTHHNYTGDQVKDTDHLAHLMFRAVTDFQFSSLSVLYSLPETASMALKSLAQATFLDMAPTRVQTLPTTGDRDLAKHFHIALGFLNVVRTIMLHQREGNTSNLSNFSNLTSPNNRLLGALDGAIVDKLGEMWYVLQECSLQRPVLSDEAEAVKHAILRDWLPAMASLILLHVSPKEQGVSGPGVPGVGQQLSQRHAVNLNAMSHNFGLGQNMGFHSLRGKRDHEQEGIDAAACIALVGLYLEVASTGCDGGRANTEDTNTDDGHCLRLQTLLLDTAMLLADGLSEDTRQHCVRTLRDLANGCDLPQELAYVLSCPASGSPYYPRFYLERQPSMALLGRTLSREASGAGAGPGAGGPETFQNLKRPAPGLDRCCKRVRFCLKTWDAVSDPSPAVQENDTAVNLWLLDATKVLRQRRR